VKLPYVLETLYIMQSFTRWQYYCAVILGKLIPSTHSLWAFRIIKDKDERFVPKMEGKKCCRIITFKQIPGKMDTGIRGLMRGMATLPRGNQELLVGRVEDPQVSFG